MRAEATRPPATSMVAAAMAIEIEAARPEDRARLIDALKDVV